MSWLWTVRSQALGQIEASAVPDGTGDMTSATARRVFLASRKWCDRVLNEVLTAAVVGSSATLRAQAEAAFEAG